MAEPSQSTEENSHSQEPQPGKNPVDSGLPMAKNLENLDFSTSPTVTESDQEAVEHGTAEENGRSEEPQPTTKSKKNQVTVEEKSHSQEPQSSEVELRPVPSTVRQPE